MRATGERAMQPQTVAEALLWQEKARPVDGDGVGYCVGPARVLWRQTRGVGGGQDGDNLVEAKQYLGLGREADRDVPVDSTVREAEQTADVGLLSPLWHVVSPRREAARDAEAEDQADDAASRRATRSALLALFAVVEVMIFCDAELALGAGEARGAVL